MVWNVQRHDVGMIATTCCRWIITGFDWVSPWTRMAMLAGSDAH
jgi:hypothetical protein